MSWAMVTSLAKSASRPAGVATRRIDFLRKTLQRVVICICGYTVPPRGLMYRSVER